MQLLPFAELRITTSYIHIFKLKISKRLIKKKKTPECFFLLYCSAVLMPCASVFLAVIIQCKHGKLQLFSYFESLNLKKYESYRPSKEHITHAKNRMGCYQFRNCYASISLSVVHFSTGRYFGYRAGIKWFFISRAFGAKRFFNFSPYRLLVSNNQLLYFSLYY